MRGGRSLTVPYVLSIIFEFDFLQVTTELAKNSFGDLESKPEVILFFDF